ncbi:MAG: hypothetical protein ABSD58_16795 [Verrucomicrobiia bacterium]|jgi:hypothetical protein
MYRLPETETSSAVNDLDELLTDMFGIPAPPKEEILRHKWLESEKAGRDIGVLAAAYDWRLKYYRYWREYHVSGVPASQSQARSASRRRLEVLAGYALLPLAILLLGLALWQWATGIDYTDYISGHQIMYVPR